MMKIFHRGCGALLSASLAIAGLTACSATLDESGKSDSLDETRAPTVSTHQTIPNGVAEPEARPAERRENATILPPEILGANGASMVPEARHCDSRIVTTGNFHETAETGEGSSSPAGQMTVSGTAFTSLATATLPTVQTHFASFGTASAKIHVDHAYVSTFLGSPYVRLTMYLYDESGRVACDTTMNLVGAGAPSRSMDNQETTLSCPFSVPEGGGGRYAVSFSLESGAGAWGDAAFGTLLVESTTIGVCADTFNLVDTQTGRCADVWGGLDTPQTRVDEFTCIPGAINQEWQLTPEGLIRGLDGECLNVPIWGGDWNPADGIGLQIFPCTYPVTPNEVWRVQGSQLIGLNGKCLTSTTGGNGDQLSLWSCGQHAFQSWQMRY